MSQTSTPTTRVTLPKSPKDTSDNRARTRRSASHDTAPITPRPDPIRDANLALLGRTIARAKRCIVLTGAGISCSAGIPDFRSEDGLYNLVKQRYPDRVLKGQELFDASLFRSPQTTEIFYTFMGELQKACTKAIPTPTHHFVARLKTEGRLLRCYTQNIDGLERVVEEAEQQCEVEVADEDGDTEIVDVVSTGNDSAKLAVDIDMVDCNAASDKTVSRASTAQRHGPHVVQLHGTLERVRCTRCCATFPFAQRHQTTFIAGTAPACPACEEMADARAAANKRPLGVGSLRPDIVLYNELHPGGSDIARSIARDLRRRPDLLLVMGTSLKVPGCKQLVREAAKAVRAANGTTIFVNPTPVLNKEWDGVFDWWVEGNSDDWVDNIQGSLQRAEQERQARRERRQSGINAASTASGAKGIRGPVQRANSMPVGQTKITSIHRSTKPRSILTSSAVSKKRSAPTSSTSSSSTSSVSSNNAALHHPSATVTVEITKRPTMSSLARSQRRHPNLPPPSTERANNDKSIAATVAGNVTALDKLGKRRNSMPARHTLQRPASLDSYGVASATAIATSPMASDDSEEEDTTATVRMTASQPATPSSAPLQQAMAAWADGQPLNRLRVTRRMAAREEAEWQAAIEASLQESSTSSLSTLSTPPTTPTKTGTVSPSGQSCRMQSSSKRKHLGIHRVNPIGRPSSHNSTLSSDSADKTLRQACLSLGPARTKSPHASSGGARPSGLFASAASTSTMMADLTGVDRQP